MKARFKCGNIVRRVDTGRCGMCGDSIPTGSILRVMSDEDDAGVVRVHYPQGDEDEEIQEVMWYEIKLVPTEAKVEKVCSNIIRVKVDDFVVASITPKSPPRWALFISSNGAKRLPCRWLTSLTFKSHWGS